MAYQYLHSSNKRSAENVDSNRENQNYALQGLGNNNSSLARLDEESGLKLALSMSLLQRSLKDNNSRVTGNTLPFMPTPNHNDRILLLKNSVGGYASQEQNVLALAAIQQQLLHRNRLLRQLEQSHFFPRLCQQPTPSEVQSNYAGAATLTIPSYLLGDPSLNVRQGKSSLATVSIVDPAKEKQRNQARLLEELGNVSVKRRKENSAYFDASTLSDPSTVSLTYHPPRGGGVTEPFPERLHRLLTEVEENSQDDIIGFFAHGRAFAIHDRERFVKEIMPKYFKQSRLSSFQRQLNLYGFIRINSGPDLGGYYHQLFLKGRPSLAIHISRAGATAKRTQKTTPNFYGMNPVK
eukprot:CAMPEP_0178925888 /NCGR_PEP_ID=MMETSP0786-20121207/18187_1 /TAXON_ID=186022 /ORGANISM="Thalassionema frauenfeldii, Strain CCMP 1798" /LENGTH=350 /DNA_ID=CAMNT_0020600869 /DNA_START=50 /DNA_END=1102 /DNA_ORIENTATION=-